MQQICAKWRLRINWRGHPYYSNSPYSPCSPCAFPLSCCLLPFGHQLTYLLQFLWPGWWSPVPLQSITFPSPPSHMHFYVFWTQLAASRPPYFYLTPPPPSWHACVVCARLWCRLVSKLCDDSSPAILPACSHLCHSHNFQLQLRFRFALAAWRIAYTRRGTEWSPLAASAHFPPHFTLLVFTRHMSLYVCVYLRFCFVVVFVGLLVVQLRQPFCTAHLAYYEVTLSHTHTHTREKCVCVWRVRFAICSIVFLFFFRQTFRHRISQCFPLSLLLAAALAKSSECQRTNDNS